MIFSIKKSVHAPTNCHCNRIVTITGVTVSREGRTWYILPTWSNKEASSPWQVLCVVVAVLALDPPPGQVAAADAPGSLDHPLLLQHQRQPAAQPENLFLKFAEPA